MHPKDFAVVVSFYKCVLLLWLFVCLFVVVVVVVWFGLGFFSVLFIIICFITLLSLAGNSGRLTRVRHSSRKSSATHSYQCVQYFRVSKRRPYGCQCSGFLTCAQMLLNAISHGGCTESALRADWEKNPLPRAGLEPASVLRLVAFQCDTLPTELLPPPQG